MNFMIFFNNMTRQSGEESPGNPKKWKGSLNKDSELFSFKNDYRSSCRKYRLIVFRKRTIRFLENIPGIIQVPVRY